MKKLFLKITIPIVVIIAVIASVFIARRFKNQPVADHSQEITSTTESTTDNSSVPGYPVPEVSEEDSADTTGPETISTEGSGTNTSGTESDEKLEDYEIPEENTVPPIIVVPTLPPEPDETADGTTQIDYAAYHSMSADEQKEFIDSFDSLDAFFEWYAQAEKQYNDSQNDIVLDGNTNVEFGSTP